jgi:CMP-2-keto-3-deoxyoctulosonic acid synthetase
LFFHFANVVKIVKRYHKNLMYFCRQSIGHNVPALAAGGELEPQNCHAKQMQFRKKKLPPKL